MAMSYIKIPFRVLRHKFIFHRTMTSLPKVIVRYAEDEPHLELSFRYGTETFSERQFNFIRSKEEYLELTLSRIEVNITKAVLSKRMKKKKSGNESAENPHQLGLVLSLALKRNAEIFDASSTRNIDAWIEGAFFKVGGMDYRVCVNAPTVKSLKLPSTIMAGFPVYPRVELRFCDTSQCLFEWFKLCSKNELKSKGIENLDSLEMTKVGLYYLKVGEGFFHHTSNEDIGKILKICCEPRMEDRSGLKADAVSNMIEAGPGPCPCEKRLAYTQHVTSQGSFRCVSYNILADLYADSDFSRTVLFPYCPPYALKLDYRKQLLLKEILGYNGDILCLQEVDTKVYKNDISSFLEQAGLLGCFNEKGGQVAEGLALLFRKEKFRLVENDGLIVANLLEENPLFSDIKEKVNANENLMTRIMARTTALQVAVLESMEVPNTYLIIGNTHLYFHPNADHIRLIQAYICVRYLENLVQTYKQKLGEDKTVSVMLCGDFNSCPEFGVYQLMTTGRVSKDSPDWRSKEEEAISEGMEVSHGLHLDSSCGRPPYTNFTAGFHGCLDYIFYDTQSIEVEEVVPLPSHEEVTEYTALPSITMPSDHLALVCTLRWKRFQ